MLLDNEMKKQEHLWQNVSPNFLTEKRFNAAVAELNPHCAICSLFCPYVKVQPDIIMADVKKMYLNRTVVPALLK